MIFNILLTVQIWHKVIIICSPLWRSGWSHNALKLVRIYKEDSITGRSLAPFVVEGYIVQPFSPNTDSSPTHSVVNLSSQTLTAFFFHWRAQLHPWVTSDIVPISPGPLQFALFTICTGTAYKYRMVQFGLAWKINIIYNTTTNSNS